MEKTVITSIPISEFEELLFEIVYKSLKQIKELQRNEETFLTRKQLAERLKVTLPTIHNLTKKGKLTSYNLEGRVYYKWSEVVSAMKKNTTP